jgi:hypothetical protein
MEVTEITENREALLCVLRALCGELALKGRELIQNVSENALKEELGTPSDANPVASVVARAVETSADPFEVEARGAGLEIVARRQLSNGLPNRARMKVFSPKEGHTLVFFYKKSLVPYSRDRYSYGGIDLRTSAVEPQEIVSWLDFLTSGFHPEKRPEKLRRAFPYEIPE